MLDQGVDIPAITHAILSHPPNLGNTFKEEVESEKTQGKIFSYIYDIFVLPVDNLNDDVVATITLAEIKRGFDFSKDAYNLSVE